MLDALFLQPLQRAVVAFVGMHDDLMRVGGVLPDAFNGQLQIGEVVPSRDEDGEKRGVHRLQIYGFKSTGNAPFPLLSQNDI